MKLTTFDFNDAAVRVMMRDEQPWFVAADVCRVLDIQNPTDAVKGLDEDETITLANSEGNPRAGIPHSLRLISESGLYALAFKSRKPEARVFRKWVTAVVLPALRKTGKYEVLSGEEHMPQLRTVRDQMMALRELLLLSACEVRSKSMDVGRAQQVANLSARYLETIKLEGEARGYEEVFEMRTVEGGDRFLQATERSAKPLQRMPQPSVQGTEAGESVLQKEAIPGEAGMDCTEPHAGPSACEGQQTPGEDDLAEPPGDTGAGTGLRGGAVGAVGGDHDSEPLLN